MLPTEVQFCACMIKPYAIQKVWECRSRKVTTITSHKKTAQEQFHTQ